MYQDTVPTPPPLLGVHVKREIPLWGVLTALFVLIAQAVAMYYGQLDTAREQKRFSEDTAREQKRFSEAQAAMAADVRAIYNELAKNNIKTVELQFALQGLEQRVRLVEAQRQKP